MDQGNVFKGCHPQISLGPFLNTLSQINVQKHSLSPVWFVQPFQIQVFTPL